jgi:hypothetical protein
LIAAMLLASCAPAATPSPAPVVELPTEVTAPTATPPPTLAEPSPVPTSTEAPTAIPLPAATSRGPDLEATDPTAVSLATGGLHFVEFFRFT